MSTDNGYIKLYRDIRKHWIWQDKPFDKARAWIDLIMIANHEPRTILFDGHPVKVDRGQRMTSLSILAERWGWSRSKVKRFIDVLKSEHMVDVERNSNGTLITIVNYSNYQGTRNSKRNTRETRTERSRNTGEHKQYTIEDTIESTKEESTSCVENNPWDEPDMTDEEAAAGGWT